MSREEKEFIARVTHSLWLENSKTVAWSLKNFSKDEILVLYWVDGIGLNKPKTTVGDTMIYGAPNPRIFTYNKGTFGDIDYESSYKLFLLGKKLRVNDLKQTAVEVIRWQKKNFFHAYYDWGWDTYRAKNSGDYPDNLESLFEERITGCHLNAVLYSELLRSQNIPAVKIIDLTGHGLVYLPTMDRYVHGDHIADFTTTLPEDMLLTNKEVEDMVDHNDYDSVLRKKYSLYHYSNPMLIRSKGGQYGNDHLSIYAKYISYPAPAADWNMIVNEVKEYNLRYDSQSEEILSDYVKIKTLEELSK